MSVSGAAGRVIRQHREKLNMTQRQMAALCGLDLDRYRRLEIGRQDPSAMDLDALRLAGIDPVMVLDTIRSSTR